MINRSGIVAIGTCAALLCASVASALPGVESAADAGTPASRGTMVQETPTLPPPGMTYVFDAESCRRLVRPSCLSSAGHTPNTALEAIQEAPGAFEAVVIGTGYNEGSVGFGENFDLIVSAARAKGAVRIVWMNYRMRDGLTRGGKDNNGSYVSNNATLLQKVASGAYPDVFIANWRDYSEPVRSWFVSDGIHYQPTGALGAADCISRWITHLFLEPCPKPMTLGGPIDTPCASPDGTSPPDVRALYG